MMSPRSRVIHNYNLKLSKLQGLRSIRVALPSSLASTPRAQRIAYFNADRRGFLLSQAKHDVLWITR